MKPKTYFIIATKLLLLFVLVTENACKNENELTPQEPLFGQFTDPRDGKTYNIVTIGSQTWFAENLNYETSNSWWQDNNSANGNIYGRLYTWDAALKACPIGWSLPSDDEWKNLEMHLGMSQSEADQLGMRGTDIGKKLKSTSSWYPGGNGTDEVGFSALPSGYCNPIGNFYNSGTTCQWWSSTEYDNNRAYQRWLSHGNDEMGRHHNHPGHGFSVRCLRD